MKNLALLLLIAAVGLSALALTYVTNVTEEMRVRYDAIPNTNGFRLAFAGVPSITSVEIVGVHDQQGVGHLLSERSDLLHRARHEHHREELT